MLKRLRSKFARIEAAAKERKARELTSHRELLHMMSSSILALKPGLKEVTPEDTDADTYRRIEITRAQARGDHETAERLRAELPREPTIDRSQCKTQRDRLEAFARYQNEIVSPALDRERLASDAAIAATYRRLGRPAPEPDW